MWKELLFKKNVIHLAVNSLHYYFETISRIDYFWGTTTSIPWCRKVESRWLEDASSILELLPSCSRRHVYTQVDLVVIWLYLASSYNSLVNPEIQVSQTLFSPNNAHCFETLSLCLGVPMNWLQWLTSGLTLTSSVEIFSKKKVTSLPLHCAYNCTNKLLPGTSLPKGCLYLLSEPKHNAVFCSDMDTLIYNKEKES